MAVTIWTIWLLDVFAFLATFFHHRIKINLLLHSACHKTFADYFWKNFSRHWNLTWQKRSSFHTAVALGRKALIYDLITSSLKSREKYLLVCKQKRLSIVTTTHSCDELKKTFMCNRRRDVAWQLSQIEMRYTCFQAVPLNILKEKEEGTRALPHRIGSSRLEHQTFLRLRFTNTSDS